MLLLRAASPVGTQLLCARDTLCLPLIITCLTRALVATLLPFLSLDLVSTHKGEIIVPCWCGLREPSMPHLLWNCSRSKQIMLDHGASMPVNRCEERLLCKVVPDMSPPPALTDLPALPDKLIRVVRTALARASAANVMFVGASDGGSDAQCGLLLKPCGWRR